MATSKIKYDGDTSWKSGTGSWNIPVKYRLRNGICTITASYGGEFVIDNTERQIITLPEEYRPSITIAFPVNNRANNNGDAYGYIKPDGSVTLTSLVSNGYFAFCVSYPVK